MGDEGSLPTVHYDLLVAYEDRHGRAGRIPFSDPDLASRYMAGHARAWVGDIFFDHHRRVVIPDPAAHLVDPPFLVVHCLSAPEFRVRSCTITAFGDAHAAIAAAQQIIDLEGATDDGAEWEVYCVRVTQSRRPSSSSGRTPPVYRLPIEQLASLIKPCAASPDDDAPRLELARTMGGERGELVALQCALARGGLSLAENARHRRRQRTLINKHGAEWSGLRGLAKRCAFRRGLVDAIVIDAKVLRSRAQQIFQIAPLLSSITVSGLAPSVEEGDSSAMDDENPLLLLEELLAADWFSRLSAFAITSIGFTVERDSEFNPQRWDGREVEAARLLASRRALARLSSFGIKGLDVEGGLALSASGDFLHLQRLRLDAHQLGADGVVEILGQLSHLRALELSGQMDVAKALSAIPGGLVELKLSHLDDAGLAVLARGPSASSLAGLEIESAGIRDLSALTSFSRLRALSLVCAANQERQRRFSHDLAELDGAALRELRLGGAHVDDMRAIADAYGGQLEHLHVWALDGGPGDADLDKLFSGDVVRTRSSPDASLLRAATGPEEPFWDYRECST
jgi:hypothetical protein